jgi:hypothetical protein
MRNLGYIFILISIVFAFTACEENGLFFPTTSQNDGSFQVTFDGKNLSTTNVSFTADVDDIFINAINTETNEIFTLKIDDFDLGSFSFEGADNIASYVQNNPISADVWSTINETSSRGNIEFTNIDFVNNTVSGTFSFIGKNALDGSSKAFANGVFTNVPKSVLPVSNNTFTAKVDGLEYVEVSLFGNYVNNAGQELILISANKSLSETIGISLAADISVGEYDLNTFSPPSIQYTFGGTTYIGKGKINITKHDTTNKQITATFSFTADPITGGPSAFTITEGEFSISY